MASSGKDSVYSSDDEIVRPVVKRKKKSKTIVSSSDSDGEDSDIEIRPKRIGKRRKYESEDENTTGIANDTSSCSSDTKNCSDPLNDLSDNEQVDKCAICLSKFLGQDIATPEACDHVFCLECLQEWAKNVNTCPIDRLKFNLILIRHHKEEKVIKTIIVNNSELPYCSDVETESNAQSQVDYCDLCGEDENDESILRCQHCRKFYHYHCILSALHTTSSRSWQCPTCENYISLRNKFLDVQRMVSTYGTNPRIRDLGSLSSGRRAQSPTNFFLIRKRIFCQGQLLKSILSTSESSDEETECSSIPSRLYQNSVISSISKAGCPLLTKRRNEICRTRNRALVSSAATAASESRSLFNEDSGDGYSDLRFSSTPVPENYDLVGSILQSQTLLHCPDVLTLTRDGSLLRNSKQESSPRRPSANTSSPMQNSEESSQSSLHNSSFFSDNTVSPYTGGVVAKQRPLNPTQNNTSKYGETPKQTHSCTSSGASMERSLNYNENTASRLPLGANSNDRYNNEPCSPIVQRGFCSSSTSDDIKKDRPSKGHHSEDEVDIYSDIESVGDEDGSMSDRVVEPMKISFKCEDSQLSNPNDASDSSDNDLVIDEDMHAEEDDDKAKDNQESYNSNVKHKSVKNNQINCESGDSNMSSNAGSDQDQLTIEETNQGNPSSSYIDNSSDNCYNPVDESSQGVFHHDDSNNSKLTAENENNTKNDSESDGNAQESDVDIQEYEENSLDSAKKSFQADTNTPCTSVKSSPKSCRGETSDGFEIQCDNSVSNENSRYCENSCFEPEESKEVFEEASNQENENTCDSVSQVEESENFVSENNSNLSEATSQVEGNENSQNENNSNFSFESDQRNAETSEPDDFVDSNPAPEGDHSPRRGELVNICNDISMKSDDEEDNLDSLENASTPCLDENLDGQIENSPVPEENFEDTGQDFESSSPQNIEEDTSKEIDTIANEDDTSEKMECDNSDVVQTKSTEKDFQDNTVDLGIEDISDAGSDDLRDEFPDEVSTHTEKEVDVEQKVASLFSPDHSETVEDEGNADHSKQISEEYNKCPSSQSNQSFEDHEEGEIIEERPVHRCNKKKKERFHEDSEYTEYAPRVNISDLPRIPKLKRDRDKDNVSEIISFENKRTSVLSRVDLGNADISWKRLSKHTRERSYRDGRPKDERLLYRERESRNKEKNANESARRNDKNMDRRRDEKKQEIEKSKNEYESRSRKTEKNKSVDWNYTEREKRKSRKDKHSKEKHSKDKKEKDKYDKTKYSKDEDKYDREKLKEEIRYERDLRYDKEERFERIVYEKGKFKDKDHKSKHKDRKSDSKSSKDHSRENYKHAHSSDHFSDKQREREVRKIDDKLKIVVEQKESRKEKSKHKERKEAKHDKKQIIQRKIENERIPYTESTSIESKEIFAKGDSIIINVSFNRAASPKVSAATDVCESNSKDRKVLAEELDKDEQMGTDDVKSKSKHSTIDKVKCSLDNSTKRPATPPGKNAPVLSVSECYWKGGDDPDGNNTPTSDKSAEEIADDEIEARSPNTYEANNFSNSGSSPDVHVTQSVLKDINSAPEEIPCAPNKETNSSFSKENENFCSKRRSPRSPSPPSPADNDSYDPCEPTRSPSPPPIPPAPPLPTTNPKPPPSPELPPLPPEPEPMDAIHDDSRNHKQNKPPEFVSVSAVMVSSAAQPITVHTQTSMASPLSMQSMMLPPPSFLSQVSSAANTMPNMSSLVPPRNGNFQMSSHPAVMLSSNHVQPVMGGNFVAPQMHGGSTLPPPPNPPNIPHMSSVPPPPPPPAGMTLLSQVRHPHMNVHPTLTTSSLLQSLGMAHGVNAPQLQLVHQLPPNLSGILANQSPIVRTSQNQLTSLPMSIANQQGSRMMFSQNQLLNHSALFQNQNMNDCNKSQGSSANLMPSHTQTLSASCTSQQKSEKHSKNSPTEKNEVIDMEMDTPYSPAYSPSVDSVGDYSPTCSPIPSSPKNKDAFDSLFPSDQRTSEKRTHDAVAANEKSKQHSASKKSKHEHKSDSKVRHSVRMQVKDKHKKSRKEHKQTEKKESVTKLEDSQLKILDELPSSAVEMQVKEKFLKKLNRQERVVEEVKFALKPYYKSRDVTKEEYKDILRKSVPKICHNKSGEINPVKVKYLVECYVKKAKHSRKKGDKKKSSALS